MSAEIAKNMKFLKLLISIFLILMISLCAKSSKDICLQAFHYPPHAGYPLGTTEDPKYVVMETHYDNPDMKPSEII